MDKLNKVIGVCPRCGNDKLKYNNVPLTAYCWGPESKPHKQWSKVVPKRTVL